jgi:hypothetical protein
MQRARGHVALLFEASPGYEVRDNDEVLFGTLDKSLAQIFLLGWRKHQATLREVDVGDLVGGLIDKAPLKRYAPGVEGYALFARDAIEYLLYPYQI